ALTETYLGYREPADFPFADRLPPVLLRENHRQLLGRWLKDADSRPVWERWIKEVEPHLDLSEWAAGKQGLSFALPHLVALRWRATLSEFEKAADRASATREFFEKHRTMIRREVEFGKANPSPVGAWALLARLDALLSSCNDAANRVEAASTADELARLF